VGFLFQTSSTFSLDLLPLRRGAILARVFGLDACRAFPPSGQPFFPFSLPTPLCVSFPLCAQQRGFFFILGALLCTVTQASLTVAVATFFSSRSEGRRGGLFWTVLPLMVVHFSSGSRVSNLAASFSSPRCYRVAFFFRRALVSLLRVHLLVVWFFRHTLHTNFPT